MCERWWVKKLCVKDGVCVCVCVIKWCVKDGVVKDGEKSCVKDGV